MMDSLAEQVLGGRVSTKTLGGKFKVGSVLTRVGRRMKAEGC